MKSIIFTHLKPDIWQYKVAFTLRKKGIKTISISLLDFDKDFFKEAFDEIICLKLPNLKPKSIFKMSIKNPLKTINFFIRILTVKSDAAICQGAPHYLAAIFIRIFKNRMPRIYFPYDIISTHFKNPKGHLPDREILGEKYAFANCDGFIHKAGKDELQFLPSSFNIKKIPTLGVPAYTLSKWFVPYNKEKLSCKDKEIHIVLPSTIPGSLEDQNNPLSIIYSEMLRQKIHIHVYSAGGEKVKNQFSYIKDKKLLNCLHIHDFVSPNQLSNELTKYDFGIHFAAPSDMYPEAAMFRVGANKIASYFEASIPAIVNKDNLFYSKDIDKHYLGISFRYEKDRVKMIQELKNKIKRFNYLKSVRNVQKFRENYSFDNHINELIGFVDSLKQRIVKAK